MAACGAPTRKQNSEVYADEPSSDELTAAESQTSSKGSDFIHDRCTKRERHSFTFRNLPGLPPFANNDDLQQISADPDLSSALTDTQRLTFDHGNDIAQDNNTENNTDMSGDSVAQCQERRQHDADGSVHTADNTSHLASSDDNREKHHRHKKKHKEKKRERHKSNSSDQSGKKRRHSSSNDGNCAVPDKRL